MYIYIYISYTCIYHILYIIYVYMYISYIYIYIIYIYHIYIIYISYYYYYYYYYCYYYYYPTTVYIPSWLKFLDLPVAPTSPGSPNPARDRRRSGSLAERRASWSHLVGLRSCPWENRETSVMKSEKLQILMEFDGFFSLLAGRNWKFDEICG